MCSSDPLGQLGTALDALAATDVAAQPATVQTAQLQHLHQLVNRAQAELTRRVGVLHAQGGAVTDGFASTQALLRRRLLLSATQASRQVAMATTVSTLPQASAAFTAGEISPEHARAICHAARDLGGEAMAAGGEKLLLEQARTEGPAQVWRLARLLRQRLAPDREEQRQARQLQDRWLATAGTFDGAVSVQGVLDRVTGEVVTTALAAFTDPATPSDERTAGQRRVDALAEVCRTALGTIDTQGRARPQVTVTTSLETLRTATHPDSAPHPDSASHGGGASHPGGAATATPEPALLGPSAEPVSASTARRLACDCALIPAVLGARSEPLDIGRLTRLVPTGIRRALVLRDQGCRFPGCDRPPQRCDAHHARFWANGGPTSLDNLVLACTFHHWLVHEGQWRLDYHAPTDTVTAQRPDGTPYDLIGTSRGRSP